MPIALTNPHLTRNEDFLEKSVRNYANEIIVLIQIITDCRLKINLNKNYMFESIFLSLICTQLPSDENDGSFLEQITFYDQSIVSGRKVDLISYWNPSPNSAWEIDNVRTEDYETTQSGLLSFIAYYEYTFEDGEKTQAYIEYIIDAKSLEYKTIYREVGSSDSDELTGYCINLDNY